MLSFSLLRRGWDSNPRALSDKRFSRPPRYDHFDTSPDLLPDKQLLFYHIRYLLSMVFSHIPNSGSLLKSIRAFARCIRSLCMPGMIRTFYLHRPAKCFLSADADLLFLQIKNRNPKRLRFSASQLLVKMPEWCYRYLVLSCPVSWYPASWYPEHPLCHFLKHRHP